MSRRTVILVLLSLASVWARPPVRGLDSVGMTVSDLDRSIEFYTKVLTFSKVSEREVHGTGYEHLVGIFGVHARVARLQLGDEFVELTEFLTPGGHPVPADSRSNDKWFQHMAIIVSDMDRAYQRLREFKVRYASPEPQRLPDWNRSAGGILAFYFRDPDGHPLEVLQFPEGKGRAKWHTNDGRLFLGIDHTAIVITDTTASLNFYRDLLGLEVAGESENYGPEQERLNNVFGARLRITAVRGESGPGIEFLEYLAPRDGRPYPADEKANDLVHWQTRLVSDSAEAAARELAQARTVFLSSGVIAVTGQMPNTHKAFIVRDPDGHAVEIIER